MQFILLKVKYSIAILNKKRRLIFVSNLLKTEEVLFMKKYLRKIISLSLSLCLFVGVSLSANAATPDSSETAIVNTYESRAENSNTRTTYNSTIAISAWSTLLGEYRVYRFNNYSCYVGGTYNLGLGYYDTETYKHYTPLTVDLYAGNSLSGTSVGSQKLKFFANGEAKTAYFTNVTRGNTKRFRFETSGDGVYANNVVMSRYA
mgnify:CR=1 FL=1